MTRLQKPKTPTQEMLQKAILCRAGLGFKLDTFCVNLDMYVFLDCDRINECMDLPIKEI